MLCTGCGKDIPFVGKVCPYCGRNKFTEQELVAAIFPGAAFFAFAFVYTDINLGAALVASIVMSIAGYATMAVLQRKRGEKDSALRPPAFRIEEPAVASSLTVPSKLVGAAQPETGDSSPPMVAALSPVVATWIAHHRSGQPLAVVLQDLHDALDRHEVTPEQFVVIRKQLLT